MYVTAVPVSADGTRVTGTPQRLTSVTDSVSRVSAALNGRMVLSVSPSVPHIWGLPIDGKGRATGRRNSSLTAPRPRRTLIVERRREAGVPFDAGG